MSLVAGFLTGVGNIDRPLRDQTGIKGTVDYSLEWMQVAANVRPGDSFEPDETAPTFQEALKEQLGLKMVPQRGPTDLFIIDHVERPSEN